MGVNIWTKKFMLRPVTHCRSGCKGAQRTAHSAGRQGHGVWSIVPGAQRREMRS
jgi:hypothetical protein